MLTQSNVGFNAASFTHCCGQLFHDNGNTARYFCFIEQLCCYGNCYSINYLKRGLIHFLGTRNFEVKSIGYEGFLLTVYLFV